MEKLFLTFVVTIFVSLPAHISGRSINTIDGVINCDAIMCPSNSVSCTVAGKTSEDLNFYKYTRTCYDAEGNATLNVEEDLPNPIPGIRMNIISRVGGKPTEEEERQHEYWQNWGEKQQEHWDSWAADLQDKFAKSFPPGFPFN